MPATKVNKDKLPKLTELERALGYTFVDAKLPKQALTHRSYASSASYERLEFLGDALLGMIIGEALYHKFPKHDEGKLTRMRATLVRQETLVKVANKLKLSNHLILGDGERKGGGRKRASILADTVESLIGAIYLDSGELEVTRNCVLNWFAELIEAVDDQRVLKDAKSRLQEWLQGKQFALPNYELLEIKGNAPDEVFVVECQVDVPNTAPIIETGNSRRIAEQKSAEKMITQLNTLVAERVIKVKKT